MLNSLLKNSQGTNATDFELELREMGLFNQLVSQMNVKSKKKRIRRKVFKKAISSVNFIESYENGYEDKEKKQSIPSYDFENMPVTTLLKIGKQFLKDEAVIKYYYNSSKIEYYKNKNMLVSVLHKEIPKLSSDKLFELQNIISNKKHKTVEA